MAIKSKSRRLRYCYDRNRSNSDGYEKGVSTQLVGQPSNGRPAPANAIKSACKSAIVWLAVRGCLSPRFAPWVLKNGDLNDA